MNAQEVGRIWSRGAWIVAGAAVAGVILGAFLNVGEFFRSYLIAYLFWFEIPLGCMAMLMIANLTDGRWSRTMRPYLEAGARMVFILPLLFIPVAIGVRFLYPWYGVSRNFWLTYPFFVGRAVVYFVCWFAVALGLLRSGPRGRVRWSAGGICLHFLVTSAAVIDWIMTLEPRWFSTTFGLENMAAHGLFAMAFTIGAVLVLTREVPRQPLDIPNILLATVLVWSYLAFTEFLIIWAGNLPREVEWFHRRMSSGWQWMGGMMMFFQFGLPFLMLLFRKVKTYRPLLAIVVSSVLLAGMFWMVWLTEPALRPGRVALYWRDWVSLLAVGATFVALYSGLAIRAGAGAEREVSRA